MEACEELINHCQNNIKIAELLLEKGTSDTPHLVELNLELFRIALASLNGEAPYQCKHDGATTYDFSGRERCGRCGADM